MKKYIHVNQFVIKHNKKYGNTLPACRVQYGKHGKSKYASEVLIKGDSKLVYSPDKPLNCGAKCWVETESEVELVNEQPYALLKQAMDSVKKGLTK